MKSVMSHSFARVPQLNIQRSSFDRSHGHKTTFDAGYLIPVYVDEVLPGDTFHLNMSAFARLATPLFPLMDNMFIDSFFFFVPNRLIWTNWEKFNGAQDNPGDSVSFTVPQLVSPDVAGGGIAQGTLFDYMGLPTKPLSGGGGTTGLAFNNLHGRAYNLIWNTWFRDENLQNSIVVDKDDGPDTYTDYVLRRRGKRHDYFTSCLPFLQKGTAVSLPLGTSAPVISDNTRIKVTQLAGGGDDRGLTVTNGSDEVDLTAAASLTGELRYGTVASLAATGLLADLSSATAATINSLRQSFQLQAFYERDARGGTRYTEILRSHFGVISPDARLQRPEYLGGGSQPVNIHPVQGTNQVGTGATAPGRLSAFGTVGFSGHGFSKSFVEHGVIIGMVSVRADLTYQQGQHKMWSRRTRPDFFWPTFAGLGEQAVLNREIYANVPDGTSAGQKDAAFGYIPRYDEYRFMPSIITGLFRSNATGTLDPWHLSINFSALPALNDTFIQDDPPIDRVITVATEPHFIFDSFFKLTCARPMPVFGVPSSLGKF